LVCDAVTGAVTWLEAEERGLAVAARRAATVAAKLADTSSSPSSAESSMRDLSMRKVSVCILPRR
jgi:hypothetical protein